MMHFLVFGSHPRLSLAEYKALRPQAPKPLTAGAAALVEDPDWDGQILMNRLGGTVKLGDIVATLPTDGCTAEAIADLLDTRLRRPSLDFGWTVYGGSKGSSYSLSKLALPFKRALKAKGISSRWVTGEHNQDLSPAAVAKLKLTTVGIDVCLIPVGGTVHIGLTTEVQDADAWSHRDYGRPARDDRNGMLPPKLARMMVNMGRIPHDGVVLDPFCGSGTISMEAALATSASKIIGSDIEQKQVSDTLKNEEWLLKSAVLRPTDAERFQTFQSDVRRIGTHLQPVSVDCVVTEGYLGPSLRGHETVDEMEKNVSTVEKLWQEALKALHPILKPGGRAVCVWPGYRSARGVAHVDLVPYLAQLGYILEQPLEDWETAGGPLLYSRPDQHVTRRIVSLKKV